jgi:hypothetical protein
VDAAGEVVECDQPAAREQWTKLQASPAVVVAIVPETVDPLAGISDQALLTEIRRRGLTVTQEQII